MQMIMMINLAIHTMIVLLPQTTVPSDEISNEISLCNIQKKKNWEYQQKGRKQKDCH